MPIYTERLGDGDKEAIYTERLGDGDKDADIHRETRRRRQGGDIQRD